ncbi:hypothetical protein QFZ79_002817 [Arthrobacter sp. V4I6]|nr:hypothetical protein [Arthrobacter sp. V1I7]MDQ0854706.1 hypothetical protein [Arthrobacter sp. V4I6]
MACHAHLSVVTELPVYCAHPHSPWERGTDENTVSMEVAREGADPEGWVSAAKR